MKLHIRLRIKFRLFDTGKEHLTEIGSLKEALELKSEIIRSEGADLIKVEALYPFFEDWVPLKQLPQRIAEYKKQSFVIQ